VNTYGTARLNVKHSNAFGQNCRIEGWDEGDSPNSQVSKIPNDSNKSEMAVGYCTLYGDMNGGLAVIADVPKTRVYDLCRWLNQETIVIPPQIIDKPPSAELRPGQMDQDSLPPYEVLDKILEGLVCDHLTLTDLVDRGFDRATVERVSRLLRRAEFKRRQASPGLKVTDRAFGTGWRMPIASLVNW
jgi:NAD+ synthase (glutamine-hydrolysing)